MTPYYRPLRRGLGAALVLGALLLSGDPRPRAATTFAANGDAFVTHDPDADEWTIGNSQIAVTYGLDGDGQIVLRRILNPQTGRAWPLTSAPDSSLTVGGTSVSPSAQNDRGFGAAMAEEFGAGVRLSFTDGLPDQPITIRRFYACYPQAPVIEAWTRVESDDTADTTVGSLVGWQIAMPPMSVDWVNGDQGDNPSVHTDDAFAMEHHDLAAGEQMTLGSDRRSTEQHVPLVMVNGASDELFAGVIWSGSWRIALTRSDPTLSMTVGYPAVTTRVSSSKPLEVPHTFFGVTPGTRADVGRALRPFLDAGLRGGRPYPSLVTYNTWFAYGTFIDDASMQAEIKDDADLGVELFVVDAGWYAGSKARLPSDFEPGLGNWTPDPARFPNGLRPLRDLAHARGMKFGVWVEPERVNLDTVGRPGLAQESWLAQQDGSYGSTNTAQICLGTAAGRAWLLQQLENLIDSVEPDYLKWDNNFWINCNRPGHDHGRGDGNFAHVQGLYAVLQALRDRYPDLVIENCASGGNRIDFGLLRYSDVAWMDDRTSPSAHVRHNLEGLTVAFPPAYLLSFIIDSDGESITSGQNDVPLFLASRLPGLLGMTYDAPTLPAFAMSSIRDVVSTYRTFRDITNSSVGLLLTNQAGVSVSTDWDALEELNPATGDAVIFAYAGAQSANRFTLQPRQLRADLTYDVVSVTSGKLGTERGADLMRDGISVVQGSGSRAHVFVLRAHP